VVRLPLAACIAIAEALRAQGADAWIKWPNDIYIGMRKISGLLINSSTLGHDAYQNLGIGVNINQKVPPDPNATSLFAVLNRETNREIVLATICNRLEELLKLPKLQVLKIFNEHDRLIGRKVIVFPKKKESGENFTALALKYDENGLLVIERNGKEETLAAAEVSIRPEDFKDLGEALLIKQIDIAALITGQWKNELGSKVKFVATQDGELRGEYHTAVGNVVVEHKLNGRWCSVREGGAVLSFGVAWDHLKPGKTKRSTTSWSGRLYLNPLKIVTTWTLVSELPIQDQWRSVTTNKDVFTRSD